MINVMHLRSTTGLYGAERVILGLLGNSDKEGVNPALACFSVGDESLLREAEGQGILVERISGARFSPLLVLRLMRVLRKHRIDVLHTHGYKSDIVGLFAAKLAGIKVVATPHAYSGGENARVSFYEALDRFALRFFDKVLPLHEGMKSLLVKSGVKQEKITVVQIGLDLSSIKVAPARDVRRRLGAGDDTRIICYNGRLVKRKRVEDVITAYAVVRKRIKSKLVVVGEGPLKDKLLKLSGEKGLIDDLVFTGFRGDRLDYVNSSDVLVLASTEEGIPVCIIEAMQLKKPIVATKIDGVSDLVLDGETGFMVPPQDPKALSEAIIRLLEDEKLRAIMGENGRELVGKKFTAKKMAGNYAKIYAGVLKT